MAHIKSRKHPIDRRSSCSTAVAMAFMVLPGTAVYAQQATSVLPEVEVHGTAESYKADTVSSPKFTQPLLNTTQTITVIKKELVQQQGGTTLSEALRNTPGVGTFSLGENGATNTGDAIYMRGFDTSSSIFVDNVRDLGAISRDVFNIEQIEVTKGPAGTDSGRGAPTGSINLVTKQPTLKEAYSGTVGVGSGDFKRATADLNKPLDLDGGAAFRLNLLKEDSGVAGRDVVKNDRQGIAAALAFGLKTNTRTYLNYLHIDQNNIPDAGVPTIGLPSYNASSGTAGENAILNGSPKVNSKNFYGSSGDFDDVKADMFTVRVEHDFSANLRLQNTTRYGKTTQNFLGTSFMKITPANLTLARTNNSKDQENEIFSNQTNLIANFNTGAIKHSLVTGVELSREKQSNIGYDAVSLGTLADSSVYNPNPNVQRVGYNPTRNAADSSGQTDTASVYLFDTLEFSPQWQVNGGVRVDRYDTDFSSAVIGTTRNGFPVGLLHKMPDASTSGTLFNWKLGALYKPTENSSLYANYATSKQPPGGANFSISASGTGGNNSADFEPQSTRTAEIGGKWDVIDNKLALTAAIYRTTVANEIEGSTADGFFQTGKKRVQGIELGVIGDITNLWSVSAGYTTMNTKVLSGASVAADGSRTFSYTPKNAFTAWTTYKLPKGFTVSGGARYVGKMNKPTDGAVDIPKYVEAYWVYDAAATYKLSKNVDLQLNLYNLTNKDYVASINKSGYRYTPGIERSARLSANIKF
ncbi:catecholate siderophore receptor Fiu [Herminiimonas sp. NPDC097707]|uniref:catecholate siderophore receptor Fiu n=1 Tax=Herminiimonas sp. NPDC097707 TaxID=3364007 RepID=UPI00383A5742